MTFPSFDRIVMMAYDGRYPEVARESAGTVEALGLGRPEVFLNGRGRPGLDAGEYAMIHRGRPPAGWRHGRALWDYQAAYRRVLAGALVDGVGSLLVVEDDVEAHADAAAVLAAAEVPDDWELLNLGAMHLWAETPATPAGRHVLRCNGGQRGIHAQGWRPGAMRRFLDLTPGVIDHDVATLHRLMPCYCVHPAALRQRRGVVSSIVGGEPFAAGFVYDIPGEQSR